MDIHRGEEMTDHICPLCGSDRLTGWVDWFRCIAYAECTSCHARGPSVVLDYMPWPGKEMDDAQKMAIEAWVCKGICVRSPAEDAEPWCQIHSGS